MCLRPGKRYAAVLWSTTVAVTTRTGRSSRAPRLNPSQAAAGSVKLTVMPPCSALSMPTRSGVRMILPRTVLARTLAELADA